MVKGIGLTFEEAVLVKKYRQIDAIGKNAINAALNALLAPTPPGAMTRQSLLCKNPAMCLHLTRQYGEHEIPNQTNME